MKNILMAFEFNVNIFPHMHDNLCMSHLWSSGPPTAAELCESSAGGSALQRGLATGSDRTNRAAEDWNSAAAVAPTTLGQYLCFN